MKLREKSRFPCRPKNIVYQKFRTTRLFAGKTPLFAGLSRYFPHALAILVRR